MARSKTAFTWGNANIPTCKLHSRIKLDILRSYLLSYFPTVASNPKIDAVNIHLVDAFCGGGIFRDSQTGSSVFGSPLTMLQAVNEAERRIAADKTKPFKINAKYYFADKCEHATAKLRSTLNDTGFGNLIRTSNIAIDTMPFDKFLPHLLARIPQNNRTKAIFFLDQTGWNQATLTHCNTILSHLPKAEIIWNISVESLATFANQNSSFHKAVSKFGIELSDAFTSRPSFTHLSDWRKALVAMFLRKVRKNCAARYVSPFMIQHDGWGYWLLHLSNHPEANNVMKSTHWLHENGSLHEGFPGLKMLEFNKDNWRRTRMWRFDADAGSATHEALVCELGPRIRELGQSPTIRNLMESIANETPADRDRLYESLDTMRGEREISILGPNGEKRRGRPQSVEDRLIVPSRRQMILPWN